ncbi:MAG: hypothetical protein ACXWPS_01690 [Ktedonobacteraceae bacterium]
MFIETKKDYWIQEELPQIYALIGPPIIPALIAFLADSTHDHYSRGNAAESLTEIGKRYPETRLECISAISKQIELFEENDYELNAFLIICLTDLKAIETLPVIERAFEARRVDDFIVDLDDVLVDFGLKEREEIPDSFTFGNFFENLERRGSPINPDQIQIVSSGIPDTTPQIQKARSSTFVATGNVTKFSGKRVTKKKGKKKR